MSRVLSMILIGTIGGHGWKGESKQGQIRVPIPLMHNKEKILQNLRQRFLNGGKLLAPAYIQ